MGFLDKAKAAAEQAKVKAQEGVEQVQAKKETTQAYWDLGHKAYQLASSGAITHPELDPLVQRITELETHDDAGQATSAPDTTPPAETWAPTETPAPPPPPTESAEPVAEPEQVTAATPPQSPA
jgi:hypothetical protein